MDKHTLLAKYREVFTHKERELAELLDGPFISSSSVINIKIFSRDELDILGYLVPPEQNAKCVELLREANDLDKFTKLSSALLNHSSTKKPAERLFPFVKDAPRALHPSYRMWELRNNVKKPKLETPDLLLVTTSQREYDCVVRCCGALRQEGVKEGEEIWGDVNIFSLPLETETKRVVVLRIWERRLLPGVLGTFTPRVAILSVSLSTSPLPRMEAHGRVWKTGDAVLVESLQKEGSYLRAHQRIHELKLCNLKWESELMKGSHEGRGQAEVSMPCSLELELLSQQCQTLSFKKVQQLMPHLLYQLPRPHPTPLHLHFAPFERIGHAVDAEGEGIRDWVEEFYRAAEQRRPKEKRGKVGDMPVFFCLVTLRKAVGKEGIGESEEPVPTLVFQLIRKVLEHFFIDARQSPPS